MDSPYFRTVPFYPTSAEWPPGLGAKRAGLAPPSGRRRHGLAVGCSLWAGMLLFGH